MASQILAILFPMFALAGVGFFIALTLRIDFKPINRLNMDVFVSALVFSSLVDMDLNVNQLPLIAAGLIAILLPALLMLPICRVFKFAYKTWTPPHMFRNSGNLAIPLFYYTFGSSATAAAVLLFVLSAIVHITVGLGMLSKGNPLRLMCSMPVFWAALIALGLNLAGIQVWPPALEAATLLGEPAVPVMLVALGAQMVNLRFDGLAIGVVATLQSLLTGAIAFGLIWLLIPLSTLHLQMMLLFAMLPPAVMNFLFAERFNIEPNKVAAIVLFSNFFCLFTLPILLTLAFGLSS
uniref:AEC family transporter n=1 Tax=Thaumasiovibrio occultus TaxID=1891184 RepID=UPI000B360A11|nr:AEC family transporter [Thaumasiovibrio occultus]